MVSPRLCAVLQCIADYRRGADLRIGALLERRAIGRRVSVSAVSNRVVLGISWNSFSRSCSVDARLATLLVDLSQIARSRDVDRWRFANRQPGYDESASAVAARPYLQSTAELPDSFSHPSNPNSAHAS